MHSCFLAELSNALGDKKNMPIFVAENDNVVHVLRNVDQESHVDMFAFWCEYDSVNRYCTVSVSLPFMTLKDSRSQKTGYYEF